ncbi:histidine--tRNA ligase [Salisediminibacterium beveridgei]|uniref:Histidine--tRNA ligase n=1 Tax=Salisediminibacterium beveridgei TaxID=632773 RepID=A0A1D7QX08_9BACI|nr:histidine--tRNA ligase [Salisediminibacterium beveridgei]AOM83551.1 Histidyl-tRNA synthetase 2 [Salisediminibacterium beveridgei]
MRKMAYQNVKGTKDYLPQEAAQRLKVRRILEEVFEQYGCKPLETPILNETSLMASKYAGGSEILKEMYRLTDRGERDLALRYDLTIPFAKVVAMNPAIGMPFKRYEIGKVFRDGPIKTGRFREFTQCDVDIAGVKSQMAEAELMVMALDAFEKMRLDITIQYNNRKLLTGMLETCGTDLEQINPVVLILDKLDKVGKEVVMKDLQGLELSPDSLTNIAAFLDKGKTMTHDDYAAFSGGNKRVQEGLDELKELEGYLQALDMNKQCVFNPFLARGLDIYTGTIYEVFMKEGSVRSSIGSGGRYDNAIGGLIGSEEDFATVGISFGLDVIFTALSAKETDEAEESFVDYCIIPINTPKASMMLARDLRRQGYRVELELTGKKLRKALDKANKDNIPYVIVIGEDEVSRNEYQLKNMATGEETNVSFSFNQGQTEV